MLILKFLIYRGFREKLEKISYHYGFLNQFYPKDATEILSQ